MEELWGILLVWGWDWVVVAIVVAERSARESCVSPRVWCMGFLGGAEDPPLGV